MNHAPKLPGAFHLLWMLFMQPVELCERLKTFAIYEPNANLLKLWHGHREQKRYAQQMLLLLLGLVPIAIAAVVGGITYIDPTPINPINSKILIISLALSLLIGIGIGTIGSLAIGLLLEINIALFGMIATFQISGLETDIRWGAAIGLTLGNTVAIAYSLFTGIILDFFSLVILSMAIALVPYLAPIIVAALGISEGGSGPDPNMIIPAGLASLFATSRILFYPLEALISIVLFSIQKVLRKFSSLSTLRLSPIYWHELSYFRYPFLSRHIFSTALRNKWLARQAIRRCTLSAGQKNISRTTITRLQAWELTQQAKHRKFSQTMALQGDWLPGTDNAGSIFWAFKEVAIYLNEAANVSFPYRRIQHLETAQIALKKLENTILANESADSHIFYPALKTWQDLVKNYRQETEADAKQHIPNVFQIDAGIGEGLDTLWGREDVVQSIHDAICLPHQSRLVTLFSPQKFGKTSLLKALPNLLPDLICIFLDVQDNIVRSSHEFFQALADQTQQQAKGLYNLELPPLSMGEGYKTFQVWFERLEKFCDRPILFCIDEFEGIEESLSKQDLNITLKIVRFTTRKQYHIGWLFAGNTTLEDMADAWYKHLGHCQELKLDYLSQTSAQKLLTQPMPIFPRDAISPTVATAIYERTSGHPYLLQLYGSLIVD
ncbi:MAG: hypothetical protein AAFY67_16535, partial [Cyanobacteria bacterium J06642_9]